MTAATVHDQHVPETPYEAATEFRCGVLRRTLQGEECARAYEWAHVKRRGPDGPDACACCPAGCVRARVLHGVDRPPLVTQRRAYRRHARRDIDWAAQPLRLLPDLWIARHLGVAAPVVHRARILLHGRQPHACGLARRMKPASLAPFIGRCLDLLAAEELRLVTEVGLGGRLIHLVADDAPVPATRRRLAVLREYRHALQARLRDLQPMLVDAGTEARR